MYVCLSSYRIYSKEHKKTYNYVHIYVCMYKYINDGLLWKSNKNRIFRKFMWKLPWKLYYMLKNSNIVNSLFLIMSHINNTL